jgi:hypothetical protein
MIALVEPSVDPALAYVRALPWAPSILAAGAAALALAAVAMTRRHPGEAALAFALCGGALALVLAELGRGELGFGVAGVGTVIAAAAALVAGVARRVPEAPRVAPGNDQRTLAVGVVLLLGAAVTIAALAVDWPGWNAALASTAVTGGGLGALGVVGLLTRRHWVSLALALVTCAFALVTLAAALPGPAIASFAAVFLAWAGALGIVVLALSAAALERGHGPWVEALEEDPR